MFTQLPLWGFRWCFSSTLWAILIWVIFLEYVYIFTICTHDSVLLSLIASDYVFKPVSILAPLLVAVCTTKIGIYVVTHL